MNKKKLLIVLGMMFCISNVHTQTVELPINNNAKVKMDKIGNIITNIDSSISLEQCGYFIFYQNYTITRIDERSVYIPFFSFGVWMALAIPSGQHIISFKPPESPEKSLLIDIETGKYYTFDFKSTERVLKPSYITISVKELTDTNILESTKKIIVDAKKYIDWSQTHFGALEGVYQTKDGEKQISLIGNKFNIYLKKSNTTYNGTFWFNEETIILRTETWKNKENKIRKGHLYYNLNNDLLDITDDCFINNGTFSPSIKGQYYKNK